MNFLFLSPAFPPQFFRFCVALRARGVTVLGLGDTPPHELSGELRSALTEYVYVPGLDRDFEAAYRGVAGLIARHGRLAGLDSHTEYWLSLEARLREDFNVPGPRPAQLAAWQSKAHMAEVFAAAGLARPEVLRATSPEAVRAFARQHGFPLIFKPDRGVGAASTFRVDTEAQLTEALARPLDGVIVQPFVEGRIVSYDGLVDGQGRVVFDTHHAYSSGIMEVVQGRLDVSYWSLREVPPPLRAQGRRALQGFGVRGRFFHLEFFELPDGRYQALELNARPPGGFTTDMMNYTADIDVYALWARMVSGEDVSGFTWEPRYHVAHVSRRRHLRYREPHEAVVRHLGERLLWHRALPGPIGDAMGEQMYLVRHPELAVVQADIAFIQAQAG